MHDAAIPPSLAQWQNWFASMILSPIRESDSSSIPLYPRDLIKEITRQIAPSPTLKSEERMGIYKQQYWWRLISVMQELFPSLVALFDYEDFNRFIAEPYLCAHPPHSWFISYIGLEFPEWFKNNYRKKNRSLLFQLACFDLAYEALLFVDILPKIDLLTLSKCEDSPLFLQPFVLLFTCNPDLFDFHRQLLCHPPSNWKNHPLPDPKKTPKTKKMVLYRNQESTLYEEVSPSFFQLLLRFQKGSTLADLAPLLKKDKEIISSFQLLASRGWLTLQNPLTFFSFPKPII